jgi:hypothetical protein
MRGLQLIRAERAIVLEMDITLLSIPSNTFGLHRVLRKEGLPSMDMRIAHVSKLLERERSSSNFSAAIKRGVQCRAFRLDEPGSSE